MILKINNKEYEVATNIGTAYDLEKRYSKKIKDILEDVESYSTEQVIEMIYVGFKRRNQDISLDTFKELILNDDNISYLLLIKELTVFCRLCMSVNKSEKEIREVVDKIFDRNLELAEQEIEDIEVSEDDQKN